MTPVSLSIPLAEQLYLSPCYTYADLHNWGETVTKIQQLIVDLVAGAYVWHVLSPFVKGGGYLVVGHFLFLKVAASKVGDKSAVHSVSMSANQAASLLQRVPKGQRSRRTENVTRMAQYLKTEENPSLKPITIDSRGRLIDGQHCLAAVLQSGMALKGVHIIVDGGAP